MDMSTAKGAKGNEGSKREQRGAKGAKGSEWSEEERTSHLHVKLSLPDFWTQWFHRGDFCHGCGFKKKKC